LQNAHGILGYLRSTPPNALWRDFAIFHTGRLCEMNILQKSRAKSPWILHYDAGACNGCDIEILACLTPVYDIERFGMVNVGNPKHADVLLVTGTCNKRSARVLKNLYDQMPDPKVVVAVGACALSGGIFHECYNVLQGVDGTVPVDVYVPGCAPRPEAIMEGVMMALEKMNKR